MIRGTNFIRTGKIEIKEQSTTGKVKESRKMIAPENERKQCKNQAN